MQSLQWYANRLARMSGREIAHRLARTGRAYAGRIGRAERAPPPPGGDARGVRFLRAEGDFDVAAYVRRAEAILAGRHTVFGLRDQLLGHPPRWNRDPLSGREAPLVRAAFLDHRDERLVGDIKHLWEPNRHLHLPALAQAHALTGEARFLEGLRLQIESWIEQCPGGFGPNWTSSLELGIRLVNWSLCWQLLHARSDALRGMADGERFVRAWLDAAYCHARHVVGNLSRFSSANNHLIGEAAGVFIASLTWPHWPEMERWGARCRAILEREALAQNAPDGGNREQAIAYQQFVLDFLLLAGLAARARGEDFPSAYWQRIERMIDFAASLRDAGGHMPMIGDADDGYVVRLSAEEGFCPWRSLAASGALLFGRHDLAHLAARADDKTKWLFGAGAPKRLAALAAGATAPYRPRQAFPESGYYLLGGRFGTDEEIRLLVDAGPLGYLSLAAHGHADALAIVLSVGGREVLIDPGTYAYHTQPQWRRHFHSTHAHNTVVVDDRSQSEQGGNFLWSQHARARCTEFSQATPGQLFAGEHDGYRRLADPLTHRRRILCEEDGRRFAVTDTLECAAAHRVWRFWHFAEDLEPRTGDDGRCELRVGRFRVTIAPREPVDAVAVIRAGDPGQGGWVSRGFGVKQPATTLRWENAIRGTTSLGTDISCLMEP